ncbi:MAG: hypothetical protein AB1861_30070 [Cyanobacteriota bacterium]
MPVGGRAISYWEEKVKQKLFDFTFIDADKENYGRYYDSGLLSEVLDILPELKLQGFLKTSSIELV